MSRLPYGDNPHNPQAPVVVLIVSVVSSGKGIEGQSGAYEPPCVAVMDTDLLTLEVQDPAAQRVGLAEEVESFNAAGDVSQDS